MREAVNFPGQDENGVPSPLSFHHDNEQKPMKKNTAEYRDLERAFTRLELVMIVATLVLLTGVALPLLAGTRARSEQVSCLSNLRQDGHAFQVWANDHGDKNP